MFSKSRRSLLYAIAKEHYNVIFIDWYLTVSWLK